MISDAAIERFTKPTLPYIEAHVKCLATQYSEENPDGSIVMTVSENKLCSETLMAKVEKSSQGMTSDVLCYTDPTGLPLFKAALSSFLSDYIYSGNDINTENIIVTAGCTSLLHALSVLLFNPGDGVMIPTPFYPAFVHDFSSLGKVQIIPVDPSDLSSYNILREDLDRAYEDAKNKKITAKAFLLTNPSNPLGKIYTVEEIRMLINWCNEKKIHLIVDEIYALSTIEEDNPFSSVVSILDNKLGENVHVIWGASKDLSASGFRIGVFYSQNKTLLKVLSNCNMAFLASNFTQFVLANMLNDRSFIKDYFHESSMKLKECYQVLKTGLESLNIPFYPLQAGLFVFVNFQKYLIDNSFEGERKLFQDLLSEINVIMTPGEACQHPLPGFFRACFGWVGLSAVNEFIHRLKKYDDKFFKR